MKLKIAIEKMRDTIRLKHLSLATEQSYIGWLVRFSRLVAEAMSVRSPLEVVA